MGYFSERELGTPVCDSEVLTIPIWNGLITIIQSFISNNALSQKFPLQCPDGIGIYGCDEGLFNDKIKALIPNIDTPLSRIEEKPSYPWTGEEKEYTIDIYSVLDLIEFIYKNLSDPILYGTIHSYFGHYHLKFKDEGLNKKDFQEQVNELFRRNKIAFLLENGVIKRTLPKSIVGIINQKFTTADSRLNELLQESTYNIIKPDMSSRINALEKLWDAFERLKTYYSENKKTSIEQIIKELSNGNALLETDLNAECKSLTTIGNTYQIRHFEKDKQEIKSTEHIDYFYFRMFSFINLFTQKMK